MINDICIMFSCILIFIAVIWINIILWKGYRVGKKLKEKTYHLGKKLTNEKVEDYMKYIDSVEIPPTKCHWNMLKAGYKIIELNGCIDEELIRQLKITILSKGILIN